MNVYNYCAYKSNNINVLVIQEALKSAMEDLNNGDEISFGSSVSVSNHSKDTDILDKSALSVELLSLDEQVLIN